MKENNVKLCNHSDLKKCQPMSKIIFIKRCWKTNRENAKKDCNDSDLRSWVRSMFLIISCDRNQPKSTVIFPQNSTSSSQDQCLGTVKWTFLIESTKANSKEDKKFLKKSSTETLTSISLKVFREWSKGKKSFHKKEQRSEQIQQVVLEIVPLHQRYHMESLISRQFTITFTSILKMQRIIKSLSKSSPFLLKTAQRNQEQLINKRRPKKAEGSSHTQNMRK